MLKVWRHSCITRLWRYWITSDKAYTLANIFMTLNVYLCAEFNAHALVCEYPASKSIASLSS
ncbi:hypothetical protein DAPPUDRAFT_270390 [Daphnia pulex]|uniref:Uncharacterized protein n=1 Tax=Daphnia pulex TaxID=6669 RepID=E9I0M5_DAPPU|nr:hypothetical protein DAPPUDRAFT_270390 [Daphnia pulex]|eukprot:EFX62455.1 hypothetical protein DAPPUDRAFT_270390 [Daphnia pulex]